ncbi:ComEC/Rec2 family competence protein [Novosphingobium sp. ZN18A2]|uniref:ComEC/Rec2 family competence protein n=2 Tax=Novosphingobium sp. ZN18A2 TaxID=3079861 RepID=UPI0030CCA5A5
MAPGKAAAAPLGDIAGTARHWDRFPRLSSVCRTAEKFLAAHPFERGPWLAVAFACGIAAWFVLPGWPEWTVLIAGCAACAVLAGAMLACEGALAGKYPVLLGATMGLAVMAAAGCATIWTKSALAGVQPLPGRMVTTVLGRIVDRQVQPAHERVRLVLDARIDGVDRAARVRINLLQKLDAPDYREGAVIRVKARLMPPAGPMLPGAYDFARTAWFRGWAATGSALGRPTLVKSSRGGGTMRALQHALSRHVRAHLGGTPGAIAAAFASGDRGGIRKADEDAMRDAGLTHLLSISGLHVSAVIAAAYFLTVRLLALWPALALRVRLPLVAAGAGAVTGIFYTLLTGAQVPTVRSCIGAVLVLGALALGRDPLSMRLVAAAALFVMAFWPEAVAGPSFQLSFAAVIAIVALHSSAPMKAFAAPREEGPVRRLARGAAVLLATGVVIELVLMPIGLFHFHRAGVYGALANVIAIPLTTFVSMPLIAVALVLDLAHIGAPVWWLAGQSLDLLIAIARFTASRPGAVTLMPAMGGAAFALFVGGGLWLALWSGRVRLAGLVPIGLGVAGLAFVKPPDVLVTGDGRNVAIAGAGHDLFILREGRSSYTRDNLKEMAGRAGEPAPVAGSPGARCSPDFCSVTIRRGGRNWHLLMARSRYRVDALALAAACERADIVIADRWLPSSCRPRWIKADRRFLERAGGLSIDLESRRVTSVASQQGRHGWERLGGQRTYIKRPTTRPAPTATDVKPASANVP